MASTTRTGTSSSSGRRLNAGFATAHGLGGTNDEDQVVSAPSHNNKPSKQRIDWIVKQARASGKLNASNAGLTLPLHEQLFDLRVQVDLSLSRSSSETTAPHHTAETVTGVDFSDNALGGRLDDPRLLRFPQVQSLRFKRCGLTGMTVDLASLEYLVVLDLSGNQLQESFDLNLVPPCLHELNLSNNQLRDIIIGDDDTNNTNTKNLEQLTSLDLSENKLSTLEHMDHNHLSCENLQTFRCHHNQLKAVPLFLESARKSLLLLDVSNNSMDTTTTTIDLSNYSKLQTVLLALNKLSTVPCIPRSVSRLDLSANKLTTIQGLFAAETNTSSNTSTTAMTSPSLVDLFLQDNYLTELDAAVMEQCTKLVRLDLSSNKLKALPYQLGFLTQLQTLGLTGNPLFSFKAKDLDNPRALLQVLRNRAPKSEQLSSESSSLLDSCLVQNNQTIKAVGGGKAGRLLDLDHLVQELRSNPTIAFGITGQLVLDNNRLDTIPVDLLPLLPNVIEVSLTDNVLTVLPASLGTSCSHLTRLHLARNMLTSLKSLEIITTKPMAWSQTLTRLDLSTNRLTSFPQELLTQLVVLESLNLATNRIQSVHDWTWLPSSLTNLDLSDNSIEDIQSLVLVMGGCCPRLQALFLKYNKLKSIPATLGLLSTSTTGSLKYLNVKGNPQQSIRSQILEKPCPQQLEYLRNRLTPEQAAAATERMADIQKRASLSNKNDDPTDPNQTAGSPPDAKPETSTSTATVTSPSDDTGTTEANSAGIPKTSLSNKSDCPNDPNQTAGSPPDAEPETSTSTATVASPSDDTGTTEANSLLILTELKSKIQEFEGQLENPSLSQAKRYAVKKSLAMERSKLIREERKLGIRK
jgi:Leucine-rich repeat (LRR) protein